MTIFHTAPTAIRALRKFGPDEPGKYNYQFKHMTTVGEPIEPEVWRWYYNTVGKGAAVVPVSHEIKGKEPDLYVSLKPGFSNDGALAQKISDTVCNEIGKIAKPRKVWIVKDMPKTRSGKIMRRVLGALSNNRDAGDVSTLANPEIVDEIRQMIQG